MPSRGDIVLLDVPFSDLSATRRRPAIVISNDRYNAALADMIVVALTTSGTAGHGAYSFEITNADLVAGAGNQPTRVRVDKVYTLLQASVVKTFGKVNDATLARIGQMLADLCGP
jgi:mRNA interferase MazF